MTDAGEMQVHLGGSKPGTMTRTLDGGWLPIPVITTAKNDLILRERSFVAPCDEPGSDPTRLNRRSVCVTEFTVTNTLGQPADVSLSLNFLLNAGKKQSAVLSSSPRGWAVLAGSGEIGLVTTDPASSLTASTSNGTFSLTGKLSPHQAASLTLFLPVQPMDLGSLPTVAKLRADTEAYWNAVMAPAIQIETPDPLLNKPMRAVMVNGVPHKDFEPQKETIRILPNGAAPIVVRASY